MTKNGQHDRLKSYHSWASQTVLTLCDVSSYSQCLSALHGKQDKECNHQTEETHSFRQSEAQDGIGEELLLQRRVPGERGKDRGR